MMSKSVLVLNKCYWWVEENTCLLYSQDFHIRLCSLLALEGCFHRGCPPPVHKDSPGNSFGSGFEILALDMGQLQSIETRQTRQRDLDWVGNWTSCHRIIVGIGKMLVANLNWASTVNNVLSGLPKCKDLRDSPLNANVLPFIWWFPFLSSKKEHMMTQQCSVTY